MLRWPTWLWPWKPSNMPDPSVDTDRVEKTVEPVNEQLRRVRILQMQASVLLRSGSAFTDQDQ